VDGILPIKGEWEWDDDPSSEYYCKWVASPSIEAEYCWFKDFETQVPPPERIKVVDTGGQFTLKDPEGFDIIVALDNPGKLPLDELDEFYRYWATYLTDGINVYINLGGNSQVVNTRWCDCAPNVKFSDSDLAGALKQEPAAAFAPTSQNHSVIIVNNGDTFWMDLEGTITARDGGASVPDQAQAKPQYILPGGDECFKDAFGKKWQLTGFYADPDYAIVGSGKWSIPAGERFTTVNAYTLFNEALEGNPICWCIKKVKTIAMVPDRFVYTYLCKSKQEIDEAFTLAIELDDDPNCPKARVSSAEAEVVIQNVASAPLFTDGGDAGWKKDRWKDQWKKDGLKDKQQIDKQRQQRSGFTPPVDYGGPDTGSNADGFGPILSLNNDNAKQGSIDPDMSKTNFYNQS
jgi:hypothetical protein